MSNSKACWIWLNFVVCPFCTWFCRLWTSPSFHVYSPRHREWGNTAVEQTGQSASHWSVFWCVFCCNFEKIPVHYSCLSYRLQMFHGRNAEDFSLSADQQFIKCSEISGTLDHSPLNLFFKVTQVLQVHWVLPWDLYLRCCSRALTQQNHCL